MVAPGASKTETVVFAPTSDGQLTEFRQITVDDGLGPQNITFTGTGTGTATTTTVPDPSAGGWNLNGSAQLTGGGLQLTSRSRERGGDRISGRFPSHQS